ncbi:MAG: glycosyltransferase family 2 protein, partial [Nanoarchaeota archaeon]
INNSDYIVVYNADSRPHPNTFEWVMNDIKENKYAIYQQLSTVFQNFDDFGNSFGGLLLKTLAVLQTRFSLAHELPRLRRTVSNNSVIREYSNAQCIGHGLFIPYRTLKGLGNFSEHTMLEDSFLGFLLRATRNPITPIPFLENITSPTSIWKNLRQKYIWYWGPMYYPYYYQHYKKIFLGGRNSLKAFILMLQGTFSAIAWALSGPILLFSTILAIININLFLGQILIILILMYAPAQYFYIIHKYNEIMFYTTNKGAKTRSLLEHIAIPILSFFVIILISIPPYISMTMEMYKRLFNKTLKKPKTES